MRLILIISLTLTIAGCNSNEGNADLKNTDRIQMDDSESINSDSIISNDHDSDTSLANWVKSFKRDFVNKYDSTKTFTDIISSGDGKNDLIEIKAEYYCLYDSSLRIPDRYILGSEEDFVTHNFALSYSIKRNQVEVASDTVKKEDFYPVLSEELRKYSVIRSPYFQGYSQVTNGFVFHSSLTIPLTDIGTASSITIKLDGSKHVK